jgi:Family of unknown function (DUF6152)
MRVWTFAALAALIGWLSLTALPAEAHHGWSAYDAGKAIKVEAPIEAVRYQNPHGEIEINYLAPPSRMQARGLPPEDLKPGATILVEAYPKRDGEPEMRAQRVTVNGKTVELR